MSKLTDEQIKQKLAEGRNYKRLYFELKEKYDAVITENKALRELVALQQAQLEKQAIQIAELQTMVFGKKRKPPTGYHTSNLPKPKPRDKASYRRPIPPVSAITTEKVVPLPKACMCGGSFNPAQTTTHDRYIEDIPLPELTPDYQAKLVTRYLVERGVCGACGRVTAGKDLGGQVVKLGSNIRLLVTHLVTVIGMSYAQVISLCGSLYGLRITDGDIANTLQIKHTAWQPAYQQLQADIRSSPAIHADETSWPIQSLQGAGYSWIMADSTSLNSCFVLANSRGASHARALLGNYPGVRITDDYGAYRNSKLPGQQQLCWAHLYRTIRDLRYNANLPKQQQAVARQWYETFAVIYQDLRKYLDKPYDLVLRQSQANELWQRVLILAQQPAPTTGEPDKLRRLKAQLLRAGQDKLFICLTKNTPCDNNRAERDLRPLVLKRKRSFGSKTEKGAQALATVLSICTTTWRKDTTHYFKTLAALG